MVLALFLYDLRGERETKVYIKNVNVMSVIFFALANPPDSIQVWLWKIKSGAGYGAV